MPRRKLVRRLLLRSLWVLLTVCCLSNSSRADETDFEHTIRPLLNKHCRQCHGPETQKGGLRLDARSFAFKGADGGPVIVPGKAHESELLRRIQSQDPDVMMPPDGERLSPREVEQLQSWIQQGATWTETEYDRTAAIDPRLTHWAWQPVVPVQPPSLDDSRGVVPKEWDLNEIDAFVLQKLQAQGLTLSVPADRRTLIRRLSFDLHGLPPCQEMITEFSSDSSPDAWEKLVDTMLNSPRYGERWAQHWLDIAHYADTHGFERDQRRDNAWRYRDWVIKSLNSGVPYDQFLKDQIAGDVLRPDDADAVIATGFLAAGPWDFVGQAETPSPVLKRLARADDLDDMVTQVMTSTCAVTVNCARCHDHKLDPISQKEYYSLSSVFAGVKRGDRIVSPKEQEQLNQQKSQLEEKLKSAQAELAALRRDGWSLADIVGGGDGHGSGKPGRAIDPLTGQSTDTMRALLDNAPVNAFVKSDLPFVDGVVIPDGTDSGRVVISSTGLTAEGVPDTGGRAWDAIRNGPVNSQFSTELHGIDFAKEPHRLLSIHANAAITFDMQEMRKAGLPTEVIFRSQVGYFGQTPKAGANVHVFVDGQVVYEKQSIGRDDGLLDVNVPLNENARFLTLMATDAKNDISHDQVCFANPLLEPKGSPNSDDEIRVTKLKQSIMQLQADIAAIPEAARFYGPVIESPPAVHVHLRGNPEMPGEPVFPGTISCLKPLQASFGDQSLSDSQRRIALAEWIASPQNPLTRRVIVNRLWHHHFGVGLVDTPSDFGLGGSLPSHPELLDWLAERLLSEGWSLKALHRTICLSAAYRQVSSPTDQPRTAKAMEIDSGNRLLWRQNARRLDAESLRDAVLTASGKLNLEMYGPGYRDFDYKEEYAPVYTYTTADRSDLWRRSVYRFIVRTTPNEFMATLDCPNAANLTPARNITTTALQALALMNNEFMLKQSQYLSERIRTSAEGPGTEEEQALAAFKFALGRNPSPAEMNAAKQLISTQGLGSLCRALLNSNEFICID